MATAMTTLPQTAEYFTWPHQTYWPNCSFDIRNSVNMQ
jgi:hypothetical protein